MNLLKKYGLFIFWFLLILDCLLCISDDKQIAEYRLYTKPILLPILASYFFINTKRSKHPRTKSLVYTGLFLSWVGDLFLMQYDLAINPKNNALLTIAVTLICVALLVYSRIFRKMNKLNFKDCQEAFLSFIGMSILNIVIYKILKLVDIDNFKYLIITEMLVVSSFVAFAANVYRNKLRKNIASKKLIPGAGVLAISMYVILAHKFLLVDATFLPGVVALTFGFGQMLTIQGFKEYLKA